jgi:hypothetical protein
MRTAGLPFGRPSTEYEILCDVERNPAMRQLAATEAK